MTKNKVKRYLRNFIFMIIMTISGFVLLPLLVILLILSLLYIPFELIMYQNSSYKNISKYSFLYTVFYKKTIKSLRYFRNNNIDYKYDFANRFFIFKINDIEYILFVNSKNKNEKTKIVNYPMDKYLKDKYNCNNYKYITDLQVR